MRQLCLPEIPATCSAVLLTSPWRCYSAPTHVLFPGATAHCEKHAVYAYANRGDAWGEAFEQGQTRIVAL